MINNAILACILPAVNYFSLVAQFGAVNRAGVVMISRQGIFFNLI
jgi:hypothetical protein